MKKKKFFFLTALFFAVILTIAAGFYYQKQREEQAQTQKGELASPFLDQQYPFVNHQNKKLKFIEDLKTLPQESTIYDYQTLTPPLLTDPQGIEKLKEKLELQQARQIASGESIFWYGTDRYLSFQQDNNRLTYSRNLLGEKLLPQKGNCSSPQQVQSWAEQFLKQYQFINGNPQWEIQNQLMEITPLGLARTDKTKCQAFQLTYRYQIAKQYPLLQPQENSLRIIFEKNKQSGEIIGFNWLNLQYTPYLNKLSLKSINEIKEALKEEKKAIYFTRSCPSASASSIIKLSAPQLVFWPNQTLKQMQPVFQLQEIDAEQKCSNTILLRALKENYYRE